MQDCIERARKLVAYSVIGLMVAAGGCSSGPRPTPEEARTQSALAAAKSGRQSKVDQYLGEGVDINAADANGDTLLHLAAANGHDALVRDLIGKGASVSAQNSLGNTPLHLAAIHGHVKCSQALLAAGASRTAMNKEGKTPGDVADLRVKPQLTP